MNASPTPLRRLVLFLGSVQLATVLLGVGIVAMAAGTILESRSGTEVARSTVYHTWWFDLYLFLIVVNLAMAVVKRLPLKRHQLSFLLTHASMILLLLGAWVSRTYGFEGKLPVLEGQDEDHLFLAENEVALAGAAEGGGSVSALPLPSTAFMDGLLLRAESDGRPAVKVIEYMPQATLRSGLVPDEAGGAGLEFRVAGHAGSTSGWLLADSPAGRRRDLGPVELELVQLRQAADLEGRLVAMEGSEAVVVVEPGGGAPPVEIRLPEALGREVDCGGGLWARVNGFYRHARVDQGGVVEAEGAPPNPAAEVELRRDDRSATHLVFSQFPEFGIVRPQDAGLADAVRLQAAAGGEKPLISLIAGPGGTLHLQQTRSGKRSQGIGVKVGAEVALEDLHLGLTVGRLLPHARLRVEAVAESAGSEAGRPCLHLETSLEGDRRDFWLSLGSVQRVSLAGRPLEVGFRRQTRPLPFSVHLEEFRVDYHPGSARPASFSSRVQLSPAEEDGPLLTATISMNRPLDFMGFRLFQESYVLGDQGGPDTTVLSVSYDPGVMIVYPAFVLLILGVGWYLLGSGHRHNDKTGTDAANDSLTRGSVSLSGGQPVPQASLANVS